MYGVYRFKYIYRRLAYIIYLNYSGLVVKPQTISEYNNSFELIRASTLYIQMSYYA